MSYSQLLKKNRLKKNKVEYFYCIEEQKFIPVVKMELLKPVSVNNFEKTSGEDNVTNNGFAEQRVSTH